MTVHLIKLCVGIEDPDHLARVEARRIARAQAETGRRFTWHVTRRMPRRHAEVLDGGALYWVMGGEIRVRQKVLDLRAVRDEADRPACLIELDPELIPVVPRRRKPFQGWRYLEAEAAPPDQAAQPSDAPDMPDWMVAELSDLGLL
jgi:hypothetical protein